jgi:transcriptional antiterminator NusG
VVYIKFWKRADDDGSAGMLDTSSEFDSVSVPDWDSSEEVDGDSVYDADELGADADDVAVDTESEDFGEEPEEELPPINPDIKWYVIHTYSGYENKVKANIEKVVENRGMQEVVLEIVVPMEEQIEIKDGRKKVTLRKVFPGYVLIKMLMTDETWYVVRNTRGVTGFVGPGSRPVPLSDDEVKSMGVEEFLPVVDYEVGDNVRVADGPLESFIGVVEDINMEKKKVRVLVSMFGRETPVELELVQIQKL